MLGVGRCEKNRSAARYSGAVLPKSATTPSRVVYSRTRSTGSMICEVPAINSAPKFRSGAAIGARLISTRTTLDTFRPAISAAPLVWLRQQPGGQAWQLPVALQIRQHRGGRGAVRLVDRHHMIGDQQIALGYEHIVRIASMAVLAAMAVSRRRLR